MTELEPLLENATALTPLAVGLVALAGLVVGIAPSSFPLLLVAAGLAAGRGAAAPPAPRIEGLWLASGFALGIATVDAVLGAFFGLVGFAVLRILAQFLAVAYGLLGILLVVSGFALLRIIHITIPVLVPSPRPSRSFASSFVLGLPFGLSTCPACTPLLLPVVAAAATTADPIMGALLMFTFGLARGVPVVAAGTAAGLFAHLRRADAFVRWVERMGGVLLLAAALFFLYQGSFYAGWLSP
jgi:cytochrome c-type biogenesis protein